MIFYKKPVPMPKNTEKMSPTANYKKTAPVLLGLLFLFFRCGLRLNAYVYAAVALAASTFCVFGKCPVLNGLIAVSLNFYFFY